MYFITLTSGRLIWSIEGRITDSRAVGRALVDRYFRPGQTRDWRATLVHATGSDLDAEHFLKQYRIVE